LIRTPPHNKMHTTAGCLLTTLPFLPSCAAACYTGENQKAM